MSQIRTALHSVLPAIRVPVVVGPMANACGGSLTAAVTKGGGFAYLGSGYYDSTKMTSELDIIRDVLGTPERGSGNRLEVGIGFLGWNLTAKNKGPPPTLGSTDLSPDSEALAVIDIALKAKPRSIWLSFCTDSDELIGWSKVIREREAALNGGGKMTYGTHLKLAINVGTVEEARVACEDAGADIIIVQGIEAGGHGLGSSPPLSSLLPLVRSSLSSWKVSNPSSKPPVLLGAGGHHSSSSLLSTLALGGDGSVYGTRFLLTPESVYSSAQKEFLLQAKEGQTIRSTGFDAARGTTSWPKGVDGRGILNDTIRDFENGKASEQEQRDRYKQAEKEGDVKRIITWAGSGIGNVDVIKPAAEVVQEIEDGAVKELKRLQGYLQ
ncbi:unnamed protein product [Sympodiomycopsis kandeliae]